MDSSISASGIAGGRQATPAQVIAVSPTVAALPGAGACSQSPANAPAAADPGRRLIEATAQPQSSSSLRPISDAVLRLAAELEQHGGAGIDPKLLTQILTDQADLSGPAAERIRK